MPGAASNPARRSSSCAVLSASLFFPTYCRMNASNFPRSSLLSTFSASISVFCALMM